MVPDQHGVPIGKPFWLLTWITEQVANGAIEPTCPACAKPLTRGDIIRLSEPVDLAHHERQMLERALARNTIAHHAPPCV